jgi:hypothetical protein
MRKISHGRFGDAETKMVAEGVNEQDGRAGQAQMAERGEGGAKCLTPLGRTAR